jgi:hypothetical protein
VRRGGSSAKVGTSMGVAWMLAACEGLRSERVKSAGRRREPLRGQEEELRDTMSSQATLQAPTVHASGRHYQTWRLACLVGGAPPGAGQSEFMRCAPAGTELTPCSLSRSWPLSVRQPPLHLSTAGTSACASLSSHGAPAAGEHLAAAPSSDSTAPVATARSAGGDADRDASGSNVAQWATSRAPIDTVSGKHMPEAVERMRGRLARGTSTASNSCVSV